MEQRSHQINSLEQIEPEKMRNEAQEDDETRVVSEEARKLAHNIEEEWEYLYQKSLKWRQEHNKEELHDNHEDEEMHKLYVWESCQKNKYLKPYQDLEENEIPEKHREKVKKLKLLGLKYVRVERHTIEETFRIWKDMTLTKRKTPSQTSEDIEERRIAQHMATFHVRMKKDPEKYQNILSEYNELFNEYGKKKLMAKPRAKKRTLEEHFEIWKKWTLTEGKTPRRGAEGLEGEIASRMHGAHMTMKKETDKYQDILSEYEELYARYGRKQSEKSPEEHFEIWKKWTLNKGTTPLRRKEGIENVIANGMRSAYAIMSKSPDKYQDILKEYEELRAQYGRRKLKGLNQQKQDAISEVRELKGQVEQAEELYNRTQGAIDKAIEDKSKTLEGPGE